MVLRIRSWKQHWDPDAELVFAKRVRAGSDKKPVLNPGDRVTPSMRRRLGLHRLRRWFEQGLVVMADRRTKREKARDAELS